MILGSPTTRGMPLKRRMSEAPLREYIERAIAGSSTLLRMRQEMSQ